MIDRLLTALQKRLEACDAVFSYFGVFLKMPLVNCDQLSDAAEKLMDTYLEDLNTSLPEEIVTSMSPLMNLNVMWLRQKGENKGTLLALRVPQTVVNN